VFIVISTLVLPPRASTRPDADAAQTDALTLGLTVGTLQLARALTDRDLSDQLLARGAETALKSPGLTALQASAQRCCGTRGEASVHRAALACNVVFHATMRAPRAYEVSDAGR